MINFDYAIRRIITKTLYYILSTLFFFLAWCIPAQAQTPYIITTVAGTGFNTTTGDNGPASAAAIQYPEGLAIDTLGALYFGSSFSRVRKISASGIITTIAGYGTTGFSGDGGPATNAKFHSPQSVAVDAAGNVYIADGLNHRIRKVDTAGIINTIAGTGTVATTTPIGIAATAAELSTTNMAVDNAGNVYIAGWGICKIVSGIITGVVDSGGSGGFSGDGGPAISATFNAASAFAFDAAGNFYFSDQNNNRVRKVDTAGIITTVAGSGPTYPSTGGFSGDGGPATNAELYQPTGLAVDAAGNIYIGDNLNNRIRKVDASGIITTIAGTGPVSPYGYGFSGDGCAATAAEIGIYNGGIVVDKKGNIYFIDYSNWRIRKISRDARPRFTGGHSQSITFCTGGSSADTINSLLAALDSDANQTETWSIVTSPAHGTLSASYTTTSTGGTLTPAGMYYMPASGYSGSDSFQVCVTDCVGVSDTTTVHVTDTASFSSLTLSGGPNACTGITTALSATYGGGTWSSGSTGVATVGSASGIITGVGTGIATISYSISLSCGSASAAMTITVNATPSVITGTAVVCTGLTTTLSDSLSGGAWSSSASSLLTVGSTGIVTGASAGIATISYTMPTGCRASIPVTVNPLPAIITGTLNVCPSLTTTLYDSVSSGVWSSSAGSLSIGSVTGVVTGVTAGTSLITYTLPTGCIKTTIVTVNTLPSNITGSINVCAGNTITLNDSTSGGAWSSSNTNASIGSAGIVTGVTAGNDTIKYILPTGCLTTRAITVNPLPATITGSMNVCSGQTTTLTDGTGSGAWSSSAAAITVVGSSGSLSGISAGTAAITYTLPTGCIITTPVTVNQSPSVITGTTQVCVSSSITLTDSTAAGVWTSGNTSIATVAGSTGVVTGVAASAVPMTYTAPDGCMAMKTITVNPLPAPITSGTGSYAVCPGTTISLHDGSGGGVWSTVSTLLAIGTTGIITGITAGSATITYSLPTGCTATTTISVNPSPPAITGSPIICISGSSPLSDIDTGGVWSSSNYSAYIDATSGMVTGISTGVDTISYTVSFATYSCPAFYTVTVNTVPSAITGSSNVCVGATTLLNNSVTGGVWSSSAPGIAGVGSSSGFVTGVAQGSAVVSYSTGTGCTVTFPMAVNPMPVAITGPVAVCKGSVITITDSTTGGVWSSPGSTGIAVLGSTTSLSATITGTGAGLAIISYTIGSTSSGTACAAIKAITVNPLPATITGTLHVCPAGTTTLTSGTGGVWSVASPLLTIGSATGTVTGITHGTGLVSYTLPTGCASIAIVTVNPLPSIITGANSVCVGLTTTLTDSTLTGTWTKSNADINIGSATGMVTGVTAGTTNIFYTLPFTGCYATKTITVNTSPGAITGPTHVCPGATIVLGNAITGGTWASSNTGIATVVASGISAGTVTGVSPGPVTITYSIGAGCSVSATITVNPLPSVITGSMQVCPALTTTLSDSTTGGTWNTTSSFASVGSATGVVTGVSGGSAVVTYTSSIGCTRTAIVTVNPSPLSIAGPSAVCIGSTISLTDPGGGTWNSSHTSVATIGSTGVVTGDTIGTTTIIYTLPTGCATSTTVTVSLSPTAITGPSTVCQGSTISLGDLVGGGLWSSSAGASVGSLSGVVTGITPGTSTTITYSLGTGCTVTKTVSVIAAPAAITGAGGGVCVGSSILLTDPAAGGAWHCSSGSATVGSTGTVTGVSAGSGNISYTVAATGCSAVAVVTVNPLPAPIDGPAAVCIGTSITETDTSAGGIWNTTSTGITVGSTGVVTGITSGVSLVTYTTGSCSITKAITVNTAPVITGATGLCTGTSTTLSGTGTGTWSTTSSLLTVGSATGVVTAGITSGPAIITYTSGSGCSATTTVNVSTGPSSIGGTLHVCVGATTDLTDLATSGTWSITPTTTATIGSSSGMVTGVAPGVAAVTYSLGTGCTTSAMVTVNASPAGITGTPQVCVDATTTLSTTSTGGLWSSSPATIATVAPTGIVTGVSAGTATISYTLAGCTATKIITVNAIPALIMGTAAVCEGMTTLLTDTTSMGVWNSASTLLAVDSVTGVVTGISIGTGIASYTLPTGCAATKPVIVNSAPDAITGTTSVCIGSTTALSDLTAGGTWSSPGSAGIISLSPTGVVLGVSLGTAMVTYSVGAASCPAVITVTVNSLPGAISGSQNVCLSATDTLTDIPGGGIWSSSNVLVATVGSATGFVYGVAPGTATINYSLGVGCTVGMTVTVHPAPAAISGSGGVCIGLTSTLTDIAGSGVWSSRDTAIAVISPTGVVTGRSGGDAVISYTVPISTGVNCAATTTITVNTVPPIEGVRNICASDTLHVSDSISGGAWTSTLVSISAGIVTSYIPGVAMLIYTLGDGCSTNAMLTVNPLPAPIVVSGGTTHICTGHTISLSDVTPGGVWNSSNTTVATVGSTGSVTTSGAGTAAISYTVPTGCAEQVIVTVDAFPSAGTISGTMNVCVGSSITLMDTVLGGFWNASNASATISSGSLMGVTVGTDTISYAVTNVCGTATTTKTITVNPLPDAGTINGVDSVCVGTNITLTNAVSGGAWGISNGYATISGAGIVTGVSAGIDTVNYRVTNSCGTAQTAFAVAVDPLPQTGTITGPTSVCIGELDTLFGAPGGGVWNSSSANATVIDGIVTGVSQGIDTIRYGFTNSCGTNATSYAVTIYNCDTITGVANVQMNKYANVEIYPNPTKGELNVINGAGYELRIYDVVGSARLTMTVASDKEVLNIGELAPGVYLVEISDPLTLVKVTKRLVIAQ